MPILVVLLCVFSQSAGAMDYALGLGVEARIHREVNPDFTATQSLPHVFTQVQIDPWSIHLEVNRERLESQSGNLQIKTVTWGYSAWGRFIFRELQIVSPFLGIGFGGYHDLVETDFAGTRDRRKGFRKRAGVGGGLRHRFFDHLLVEAEARAEAIEDNRQPAYAFIFRAGFCY